MSVATMIEMERLRQERDEARAERDALEAHVERLFEVWDTLTSEDRTDVPTLIQHVDDVFIDGPTTSLARRDAEVAAHTAQQIQWNVAADCIGHETLKPSVVLGWLSDYAVTYRRQAEGGNDGEA